MVGCSPRGSWVCSMSFCASPECLTVVLVVQFSLVPGPVCSTSISYQREWGFTSFPRSSNTLNWFCGSASLVPLPKSLSICLCCVLNFTETKPSTALSCCLGSFSFPGSGVVPLPVFFLAQPGWAVSCNMYVCRQNMHQTGFGIAHPHGSWPH